LLLGPDLLDAAGMSIPDRYLWSAILSAPYARVGDPIGQNFPVRPLAVDASSVAVTYEPPFRPPKVVAFQPPSALHVAVRADAGAGRRLTVGLPQSDKTGPITTDCGREVVAVPMGRYDTTHSDWPYQPFDMIVMPPGRLVDGRVSVAILSNNQLFKLFVRARA